MNRLSITAENAEFQIIRALKLSRLKRNKSRELFVEGIACIKQAINAHIEITRIITKHINGLSDWGKNIIKQYESAAIIEMREGLYNSLCDRANPSELLITAKVPKSTPEDIRAEKPFILVFDRPSDYGNMGSIIRSANAFNVDGIFIVGHGIDVYESKVIRASLGSIFFTRIIYMESMEVLRKYIHEQKAKNNMLVLGTDSGGTVSLQDEKPERPVMVIIGNEAKGMSVQLKELCDTIIKIPVNGNINSLNVSCAASIIMWEIFRQKT
jgi:TrmH family RNA methyltransferase